VAVYDLERLSVYLVEDNAYIRSILSTVLHQFHFGRVQTATNGADAIEHFKKQAASRDGHMPDLIICDMIMAPINGLLVLRWIRTAKECPNRFLPFIMISGAADEKFVRGARDLGVTEFLAKPFSAMTVYQKILEVIDHSRQFVTTTKYFGPDRRRQPTDWAGKKEQRVTKDKDVSIVYSADKVVKPEKPTDVWYFRLPNHLKDKVGGLGQSGPGEIPAALLEEAETQLERAALDFTDWALEDLGKLSKLCQEALSKPGSRSKYFLEINLLAHELRGQGGTFGYPLITAFAKGLFDVTYDGCRDDDQAVEIVKAHIDSMRAVIRDKVAGDGGQIGQALIKGLQTAVAKASKVA
jgi:CheY-like chemotaxis protein